MGDCVESLAEVKVDSIHSSPLIYPASHVIVESYQIGQAWFPLGEAMLTTPDNLLFLHLLDDDLQDKLLHHLSWDASAQPGDPSCLASCSLPAGVKGSLEGSGLLAMESFTTAWEQKQYVIHKVGYFTKIHNYCARKRDLMEDSVDWKCNLRVGTWMR